MKSNDRQAAGVILVTGATGLIGRALVLRLLEDGHEVRVLSRDANRAALTLGLPVQCFSWANMKTELPPREALEGSDIIIHLAGESVGEGRWTTDRKKEMADSRVLSTRNLVEGIKKVGKSPQAFILGSAIGVYGNRGNEELDESSSSGVAGSSGSAFLTQVCLDWEKELSPLSGLGVPASVVRTGIVLARDSGALAKLLPIFQAGLGGKTGSGQQWMSWIHLRDIVGIFSHLVRERLAGRDVSGIFNGTAPTPETNAAFSKTLGAALGKPAILPAPGTALQVGLGEMADLVLTGQKVLPRRTVASGYKFEFPTLKAALEDLCGGRRKGADVLEAVQWVPFPVEKVFSFFCDEKNLERLTPPFLSFNVLGKSTDEIQEGTLIDYRLKLHGLPMKWRTRIEKWKPNEAFVDRQLSGPYARWEHTHGFRPLRGGTLMTDEVLYRLPMGMLGKGVAGGYVRGDVMKIFDYRREIIRKLFPAAT